MLPPMTLPFNFYLTEMAVTLERNTQLCNNVYSSTCGDNCCCDNNNINGITLVGIYNVITLVVFSLNIAEKDILN